MQHTNAILWQPDRQRAVNIQQRSTVKQQLRLLRNWQQDLMLLSGERQRRIFHTGRKKT